MRSLAAGVLLLLALAPGARAAERAPDPPDESEFEPISGRWWIPYTGEGERLIDPYGPNVLKGDRPILGDSVFMVLTARLSAPFEGRRLPVGSGVSAAQPESREFFGRGDQTFATPQGLFGLELYGGQTAFRPKTWALEAAGVFNVNRLALREANLVDLDPREGTTRTRNDVALEKAFAELKLLTLSPHYDFLSVRAGIQPFVSDFRGFVFAEQNLGVRLFGNAGSNRWQYNAAVFDLLEKETNSGLNTMESRDHRVAVVNVFRQDFLTPGYTLELSYHRSVDEATEYYDANRFLVRPAKIGDVAPHAVKAHYFGFAGDGHVGRLNLSHAFYWAKGTDERQPLAGQAVDIDAAMAALELSWDRDWLRFRASAFLATGDGDASDGVGGGFDSVYDAPLFAGGPFSFWNRTGIALPQTGVLLKAPSSLLPSLRSSKFEGQASFVNPGLRLLGLGVDAELTPKVKLVTSVNALRFADTDSLSLLLFQPEIAANIGIDFGIGAIYRPLLNENVVLTAGLTGLLPGQGFDDLYSSDCAVAGCGGGGRTLLNGFAQLTLTY